MSAFRFARPGLVLFLMTSAACTAGSTSTGGSGVPVEDEPSPTKPAPTPAPTPTGTTTQEPPTKPDPKPVIDRTVRFDLTLEGSPVNITKVAVKVNPGSGGDPARVQIDGSYEQQLNGPFTSTATFTVRAEIDAKGSDACGEGGRSADYWFKDTDGALRGMGTSYQGGGCTMNIIANGADGFSSGTAKGTIGGVKTKSFTVTWGQPLPKS